MKALTNDEFAARVDELVKLVEPFQPAVYYDPDGDCIEFLARPDNFYGERIDDLVTVYHSEKTDKIIGSLLKGVKTLCQKLLKQYPGFKIEVRQGKVKLVYIFLAKLWASEVRPDDLATITYRKLIDVAGEAGVEVELPKAA